MNGSSTERRYRPPTHLSTTLPQYHKYINPPTNLTSSPLRDIPEPLDLFNIKQDLENMVNEPETRAQRLQRDLAHLLDNVKVHHEKEQPSKRITGGKNMNVVMERMRKQERASLVTDDSQENNSFRTNISRVSKNQLERQAALEALKKRRRRDDTDDEQVLPALDDSPIKQKSGSPSIDENVKLSNYQQEIRKKKSTGSDHAVHNGKRRQQHQQQQQQQKLNHFNDHHNNHHHHHPKKQKNAATMDDDLDYIRVKPNNQVPITTFWTAMEPYFRPFTEEDREYLMEKPTDSVTPYEIPSLGQFYLDKWAEEERILLYDDTSMSNSISNTTTSTTTAPPSTYSSSTRRSRYPNPFFNTTAHTNTITDDFNANNNNSNDHAATNTLNDTAGNTLLGRLMSSLIPEPMDLDAILSEGEDDNDDDDSNSESNLSRKLSMDSTNSSITTAATSTMTTTDDEEDDKVITEVECVDTELAMHEDDDDEIIGLEERLKRELQYVGLLRSGNGSSNGNHVDDEDDEMDWNAREDDEISAQLRKLGKELQEQIKVNEFRKARLLQVVDTQLQYDQYRQVLDVLDMQVEQSYMKRFRVQKVKKRKSGSAPKAALSEHTIAAMEKRTMCITELGAIFDEKNLVLPTKSIYDDDEIKPEVETLCTKTEQ
ncbi:histone acetyltransferases subunit 3-domain-containing protein [Zychaea mexicana]|uniref:histone acetyltransferases subunit 3-domain-containing protein n=1 Tax=Zychaea mexicana TaxID=64656 RepID=UPI0022FEFC14|nr:histone acetyltransferases subunit 3-domain-containing protein [Zychaea mexicana]KAI9477081.1 histone acetyltransferases subunit 3-domain-containing protein [Zychaea mexicana]